ncbi:hypothetical protein F4703DRAFT_1855142 [Phycomyces blakesleeanus]
MSKVHENVGLFNECNHKWTIPEWSKIPLKAILNSQGFNVGNHEWTVQLEKGSSSYPEHIGIFVMSMGKYSTSDKGDSTEKIKVSLSIIKSGMKSIDKGFSHDFEFKGGSSYGRGYQKVTTLQNLQKYLTNDRLTLSIGLAIEQKNKNSLDGPRPYPKPQPLKFYDQDFKDFQDVTIHVFKDEIDESEEIESTEGLTSDEKATIHSHKFILAAESPWFRDIFLSGMKESTENEVKIRGVDPIIFQLIFDFSYGRNIYINDSTHCINILKVADRFQSKRIKDYAFSCLRAQINKSNIFDIWEASDLYDCDETRALCEEYMKSSYPDIFMSPGWLSANDKCAISAIKIDGLQGIIDETRFYKAVLARREFAIQTVINLRKAKEKESEEKIAKAPHVTPTPSNVNIYEEIQKEAKDIKEDDKDNSCNSDTQTKTETERLERLENIRWEKYIKEELEAIQKHFEIMIRNIRFHQMETEFLANTVRKERAVMQIPGIKDIIFEAYRDKTFLGKKELSKKYKSRSIESK